jgi:nitroreductase
MSSWPERQSASRRAELDQLVEATLAALRAPSILNSQPWQWRTRGDEVELRIDRDRQLTGLDPTGRLLLISSGTALHHATTALAAAGFAGAVTRFPADGAPDVVARLRRGKAVAPDRARYDAIYTRRTDRRPFSDNPPGADDLDALRAAAHRHGVVLQVLRDEQVEPFASIVALAAAAEQQAPAYGRDIAQWSGRLRSSGDGVAVREVPEGGIHRVPQRDFGLGSEPGLAAGTGSDRGTVYAVLVTRDTQREDWLAAGEALSDVWLTLTARGLAASPNSEVVEVPQAQAALRRLLGWTGHPAIAVRIGWPAEPDPPPPSARRSGTDVVSLPGDP